MLMFAPPPPSDAFQKADLVFTGQAVEVDLIAIKHELPEGLDSETLKEMAKDTGGEIRDGQLVTFSRLYIFHVGEGFKGVGSEKISIVTEMTEEACGYEFLLDKPYLVYAYTEGDRFRTGICTRTKALADNSRLAEDELKTLRALASNSAEKR